MAGVFLSGEGQQVESELGARTIGIGGALRSVPHVLALPYGVGKAPAVRAAVRSGLVSSLVTHTALAQALLSDP